MSSCFFNFLTLMNSFALLFSSFIHDQLTSKLKALSSIENSIISLSHSLSNNNCNVNAMTAQKNIDTRRNLILAGDSLADQKVTHNNLN